MIKKAVKAIQRFRRSRSTRATILEGPLSIGTRDLLQGRDGLLTGAGTYGFKQFYLWRLRGMSVALPTIRAYLLLTKAGVVGTKPIAPTFSSVKNDNDRKRLRKEWKRFAMAPTTDGRTSLDIFQRQLLEQYLVDGRVFTIMKAHKDYPQGIAVHTVPRELLAETNHNPEERLIYGTQYAESGRVRAFRFYKNAEQAIFHPRGFGLSAQTGGETVSVPADLVGEWASGNRADNWDNHAPPLISSINGLSRIEAIDRATLQVMEKSATRMGFFTKPGGTEAPDSAGLGNEDEANDPDLPDNYQDAVGHIDELPPGWGFSSYDPAWPTVKAEIWRNDLLHTVAAALGTDKASLLADGSKVNYSSLRHLTIQGREQFRRLQQEMQNNIMRPILARWLDMQKMRIKGIRDQSWEEAMDSWQFRSYPWVDPVRDSQSRIALMTAGVLSPQDVAAEGGRDLEDVYQDFADAAELLASIPGEKQDKMSKGDAVKFFFAHFGGKEAAPAAPEGKDEETEDPNNEDKPDDKDEK